MRFFLLVYHIQFATQSCRVRERERESVRSKNPDPTLLQPPGAHQLTFELSDIAESVKTLSVKQPWKQTFLLKATADAYYAVYSLSLCTWQLQCIVADEQRAQGFNYDNPIWLRKPKGNTQNKIYALCDWKQKYSSILFIFVVVFWHGGSSSCLLTAICHCSSSN